MNHLLDCGVKWDFVQIQCNYHDWERGSELPAWAQQEERVPAQWLYERLTERGIPITVMEPLLGGRLVRLNHRAISILKQAAPERSTAVMGIALRGIAAQHPVRTERHDLHGEPAGQYLHLFTFPAAFGRGT